MHRWMALLVLLLMALGAGFFGSRFPPGDWYAALAKPAFTPPAAVFAPVWTALYVAMALAAWRVWRSAGYSGAMVLWLTQLVLNAAWSWIFFGLHQPGWALVEILCLLAMLGATTAAFFRHDRVAGWLMTPYLAWVGFASVLNAALWWLNRGG